MEPTDSDYLDFFNLVEGLIDKLGQPGFSLDLPQRPPPPPVAPREVLEGTVLYDRSRILVKPQGNTPFRVVEVHPRTIITTRLLPGYRVLVHLARGIDLEDEQEVMGDILMNRITPTRRVQGPVPLQAHSVELVEAGRLPPPLCDDDLLRIEGFKVPRWLGAAEVQPQFCVLPVELMLQVFSHLRVRDFHACMLTCKSWHLLVRDPSLDAVWLEQIRLELGQRMMARARKEIRIEFRALERYQEMRQALQRNASLVVQRLIATLKAGGIQKPGMLAFVLLFQKLPPRDGPRDHFQPFASVATVVDFVLMLSTHALDLNSLLYRFGQESAVLGRTSIPIQNPIRIWLNHREGKRNLLRAVCRHFAHRTYVIGKRLAKEPHLYSRYISFHGIEGLQERDHGYWLFEFADYSADCPAYLRDWIRRDRSRLFAGMDEEP